MNKKIMEAEKKLQGAIYHFQRMKETYLKYEENFIYELEAFLVKARALRAAIVGVLSSLILSILFNEVLRNLGLKLDKDFKN